MLNVMNIKTVFELFLDIKNKNMIIYKAWQLNFMKNMC